MRIEGFPYEYFDGINCKGAPSKEYKQNNFINTFLVEKKSFVIKTDEGFNCPFDKIQYIKELFDNYNIAINQIKGKNVESENRRKDLKNKLKGEIESLGDGEKIIIAHAIWLWAFPYVKYNMKNALTADQYDLIKLECVEGVWKDGNAEGISSIGSSGSVRVSIIPKILDLFSKVSEKSDANSVKNALKSEIKGEKKPCSTFNAILHFLKPQEVEAIVSSEEKNAIVKTFNWVNNVDEKNDVDSNLLAIRTELNQLMNKTFEDFYSNSLIRSLWRSEKMNAEDLSRVQQLKYKKAMVLYGPPGTSKSYTAKDLVKQLVFDYYRSNCKDCLDQKYDWKKHYVSKQFHVNYTYEDFVGGITIENGTAEFKRGFIFEVCDKASNLKGAPFVVILDEINRTDVSRVFGEIFTAMEPGYREKPYALAVQDENGKSIEITIPNNVYIIGTMNEIDFSLERIDFALRRRFVWNYCGFDSDALEDIIEERAKNKEVKMEIDSEELLNFIEKCKALNKKITKHPELGNLYAIGHAFFADIVYILKEVKENWDTARKVLWSISIKPTLDAYCGSMDKRAMDNFLKDCAVAFEVSYKSLFENNDSEQDEEI